MASVLLLGATSAITEEVARLYAARGDTLCLVARNAQALAPIAADLQIRFGTPVKTLTADFDDCASHGKLIADALALLGGTCDIALLCYGVLGDQAKAEHEWAENEKVLRTNLVSSCSLLL